LILRIDSSKIADVPGNGAICDATSLAD
jgi:hypothetical protein